jgi:hypothetical protein
VLPGMPSALVSIAYDVRWTLRDRQFRSDTAIPLLRKAPSVGSEHAVMVNMCASTYITQTIANSA